MHAALLALLLACPSTSKTPTNPATTTDPAPADPAPATTDPAVEDGCHPDSAADTTLSGADLNTEGYRCYKEGDLDGAHRLFAAAVARDDDHALAHYNLACTMALLRAQGRICEYDAYEQAILDHHERSVALDEGRRDRMKNDSDLDGIRSTVRYQVLAGANLTDDADLASILEQATFWGPAVGVYGSTSRLDLQPDHAAVLERMTVDDDGSPGWTPEEGRWTVQDGKLDLEIGQQSWTYELKADGSLENRAGTAYQNHKSECSA